MKRRLPPENTGRVLALALVFFGALAALGIASGVHTRLGSETLLALAAFALGYAALALQLDARLRAYVRGLLPVRVRKSPAKSPGGSPAAT